MITMYNDITLKFYVKKGIYKREKESYFAKKKITIYFSKYIIFFNI